MPHAEAQRRKEYELQLCDSASLRDENWDIAHMGCIYVGGDIKAAKERVS
jgi:hypothetical protein